MTTFSRQPHIGLLEIARQKCSINLPYHTSWRTQKIFYFAILYPGAVSEAFNDMFPAVTIDTYSCKMLDFIMLTYCIALIGQSNTFFCN